MAISLDEKKKNFSLQKSEEAFNAAKVQLPFWPPSIFFFSQLPQFFGFFFLNILLGWELDFDLSLSLDGLEILVVALEMFLVELGSVNF